MDVISVKEASEILDLSPNRVREFIHDGRLSAVKIGRTYVLNRADVEAFAEIPRPDGRPPKPQEPPAGGVD